ncbi:MAG: GNAT family N-acetyltransferase, partial [Magnetococcales bacterium]|nr:GNAT family N-acetyltransferase [Magnetococcales bacterium]
RWPESGLPPPAEVSMPFGTYLVPLAATPEALWSGLHPHHRRQISKAKKAGVEVVWHWDATRFHPLLEETYALGGKKTQFSVPYLRTLLHHLQGRVLTVGAVNAGELVAALMIPHDAARGYYLHGGRSVGAPSGAAHLLHWEVMLRLRSMGVGAYDLGGARLETEDPRLAGIFTFKSRFGGLFEPCVWWRADVQPVKARLVDVLSGLRELWSPRRGNGGAR